LGAKKVQITLLGRNDIYTRSKWAKEIEESGERETGTSSQDWGKWEAKTDYF